ncbi:MAG: hypothetical protein LBF68_04630 [Christensenellaceae bacterium]|nr:hypothetical protein [Christensenellaceae bacterium]
MSEIWSVAELTAQNVITKKPTRGTVIRIIVENQSDTDIRGLDMGAGVAGGEP